MKGPEAREKCRDIVLVKVPPLRNKPDTSRYRKAGREVIDVLKQYCTVIERASVDEAYLDITELVDKKLASLDESQDEEIIEKLSNSFVVGHCDDDTNDEDRRREGTKKWVEEAFDELGDIQARKLSIAGLIVEDLRAQIWEQCEYRCSAGISYNKILAKLACGLHKPNKQTILPTAAVPGLYSSLPVKKVRNLGGKFGNIVMESLGCNVMADLLRFSLQDLQRKFDEKTGLWLWNIARGVDNEPVTNRLISKSIGASKNFPGKQAITKLEVLKQWANELAAELVDRLEQDKEENERRAVTMTVGYHYYSDGKVVSGTKVVPLPVYKVEKVASLCVDVITRATQKPISLVSMSASKFVPSKGSGDFVNYFKGGGSKQVEQGSTETEANQKEKKIDEVKTVIEETNCVDESSNDSNDLNVKYNNENKIKTYVKKETPHKSPKNKIIHSFFNKKIKEKNENTLDCIDVKVPDKKSSLLVDNNLGKTLDSKSLKGSFFMNCLKDSNPSFSTLVTPGTSSSSTKSQKKLDFSHLREEADFDRHGNESPDLFDDCSPGLKDESNDLISDDEESDLQDAEFKDLEDEKQPSALDQLKEIFPDLDNIDPAVVELLPPELQKEAKAFMKCRNPSNPPVTIIASTSKLLMKNSTTTKNSVREKTTTKNSVREKPTTKNSVKEKTTKKNSTKEKTAKNLTIEKTTTKTGKSTSKSKSTTIQNFFQKRRSNPDNNDDDADVKKCDECCQMIEVDRWIEHCDFHMAQNLQRAINKSNNEDEISRSASTSTLLAKENSETLTSPSVKRKINDDSLQATKKPRGLAAFLQQ